MKKNLLLNFLFVAFVTIASCFEAQATAWEYFKPMTAPYTMHITPEGTILVADYLFDGTGGIYRSDDGGVTWTKTDAPDYTYGKFIDAGEYIIATGAKCRVARSNDDGKTWEITNYSSALEDVMVPSALQATICYAATMHKGKLYIGDYNGGGVLYSEDFGETWKRTNRESFKYSFSRTERPTYAYENIYNIVSYKDELYAFGIYFVYRYDETNDSWIVLRSDSNFLIASTFHNGTLICGRSIMNQTEDDPFLVTFDGETWGEIKRPEGLIDNNIRCLDSDGDHLYVGLQQSGFWYTEDNGESYTKNVVGLPHGDYSTEETQHLIDLTHDENYVYVVVYDTPYSDRGIGGIYRIAKENLPNNIPEEEDDPDKPNSILDVNSDATSVYCDGEYLYVGNATAVTISDLSGRNVNVAVVDGKVALRDYIPGVYVYNVVNNAKAVAGKFIKK